MNELVLGFGVLDLIFKVIAGIAFAKVVVMKRCINCYHILYVITHELACNNGNGYSVTHTLFSSKISVPVRLPVQNIRSNKLRQKKRNRKVLHYRRVMRIWFL